MSRRPARLVVIAIASIALLGWLDASGAEGNDPEVGHVEVLQGEGWDAIARRLSPPGVSDAQIAEFADRIRDANGRPTTINSGQILHYDTSDVPQPVATTSVAPSTATTAPATTTTTPRTEYFGLQPPGAVLPTSAQCADRVRAAPEVRQVNQRPNRFGDIPNQTRGVAGAWIDADPAKAPFTARVDGDFVGTTDEIIQWAACKWGVDEDYVRAQIVTESYWDHVNSLGDWGTSAANCEPRFPLGTDGHNGSCPESFGLGQTRYQFMRSAFPHAYDSSAYNLDVTYAIWRSCFEGTETWLNTVQRGRQYAAGDMLGCMGRWFAGRWYTEGAVSYMDTVQGHVDDRTWESPNFLAYDPPPVTTTTTAPPTTTTVPPTTTTTTVPPNHSSFRATFSTPEDFYDRFFLDVGPDNPPLTELNGSLTQWSGDHNLACEGPTTSRTVHIAHQDELFWWCAPTGDAASGHVMTSLNTPSYGIVAFSPKQSFTDVTRYCWDQNLTDLGGGKWTIAMLVPEAKFQSHFPRFDYVGPGFTTPNGPGGFNLQDIAGIFGVKVFRGTIQVYGGASFENHEAWSPPGNDKAQRFQHCVRDNGNGTVTVTQQRTDGVHSWTIPGSVPNGRVRLVITDDNYDPPKRDGYHASANTWHWDSIIVEYEQSAPATAPSAPRAPEALRGNQLVKLTWQSPASNGGAPIIDYIVQRSRDGATTWRTATDPVSTVRATRVVGLVNGTRYYLHVAAKNGVGRGTWSRIVSAVPATTPSAPRSVAARRVNRSAIVSWRRPNSNGGTAITDYVVQHAITRRRAWRTVNDGVSTERTVTVGGLDGRRHLFRVAAKNGVGRGAWSAAIAATA